MKSILGLPAHPLFAHIPVVLIPLAAIGAVLMLWPRLRDRIGWFVVAIVFVAGLSTQLVISSGQSLREYVRETALLRAHTHMGENIRPWVLLMFLALLGVMVVAHLARRRASDPASDSATNLATDPATDPASDSPTNGLRIAGIALAVLSIVFSGVATYWIFRIGHSGAKAVWAPTQAKIDANVREPRGEGRSEHGG